jgi:hypothetical protein
MKNILIQTGAIAAFALFAESGAFAANFNITGPSTNAQTLGSGAGQTGTITDTGSLTVGGGTNAVTISGNNATLTNLGTLEQTGTGRAIRDNTGVTGRQRHEFECGNPGGGWRRHSDEQVPRQRHLEQLWRDDFAECIGRRLASRRF